MAETRTYDRFFDAEPDPEEGRAYTNALTRSKDLRQLEENPVFREFLDWLESRSRMEGLDLDDDANENALRASLNRRQAYVEVKQYLNDLRAQVQEELVATETG